MLVLAAAAVLTFVTPNELVWKDAPASMPPGAKIAVLEGDPMAEGPFVMRLRLPNNYKLAPHTHPADVYVSVLQGTFLLGTTPSVDIKNAQALPTDSFVRIPQGQPHWAMTQGETILHIQGMGPWQIRYVNPEDEPGKKTAATSRP